VGLPSHLEGAVGSGPDGVGFVESVEPLGLGVLGDEEDLEAGNSYDQDEAVGRIFQFVLA
jgi:hypothetical protein